MSGYPPEMQESIRRVEATRMRRLKETFPSMSLEEREQVLNAFWRSANRYSTHSTPIISRKECAAYAWA